ncbi:MAG: hypothetical protein WEB06_08775 [Actinomycetota bacterium]
MSVEFEEGSRWQRLQPRERALIILFGIIALLAVVYLLFLSGGGEEPEAFPTSPSTSTPRAPVSPTPTASPTGVPESFEVFEGKDPFRPLVSAGPIGGTPAPGGSPGPTGGPTGSGGQRVTLMSISGSGANRVAVVVVDGTEYEVSEGDTFAGSYRVKSLTADCGTFVFGDEQFTLCEGQEVFK